MSPTDAIRTRKTPGERSADIVAAAARVAVEHGLAAVTLRAVAAENGITYGLVNHYFASIDRLRAAAFAHAARADLDETSAALRRRRDPVARMAELLDRWVTAQGDPIGLLWLDGWSHARQNAELRAAVQTSMREGHELVAALITAGADAGAFTSADPIAVAWRLLTLLDGQIVHSSLDIDDRPVDIRGAVADMMERELGLPPGRLRPVRRRR